MLLAALPLVVLVTLFVVNHVREQQMRVAEAESVAQAAQHMQAAREREPLPLPEATPRAPELAEPNPEGVSTIAPGDANSGTRRGGASQGTLPDAPSTLKGRVRLNGVLMPATLVWSAAGLEFSREFPSQEGYELVDLPAGSVDVRVSLRDFPGPLENDSFRATLLPGQALVHDFELGCPTLEISGRVLFSDGSAVSGADVDVSYLVSRGDRKSWQGVAAPAKSSLEGAFGMKVPATEHGLRVRARKDRTSGQITGVLAGAKDLVIELPRSGTILLRAIDAKTRERVRVNQQSLALRRVGDLGFRPWEGVLDPVDQEGWLRLEVPAGLTEIRLSDARSGYGAITAVLDVPSGAEVRSELELVRGLEVSLRLDPVFTLRSTHVIFVLEPHLADAVRTVQTNGISHVSSGGHFTDEGLEERILHVDESGVARLKGLAPGRYRLKALPEDLKFDPQEIELTTDVKEPIVIRWLKSR